MVTYISKRDGTIVPFDKDRIKNAVASAINAQGLHLDEDVPERVASIVSERLEGTPAVEEIQDIVEKVLIELGYSDVAKEYIIYRYRRAQARDTTSRLMSVYKDLTFKDSKDNDLKRENGNIDADTSMGMMLKYGSEGAKEFNNRYVAHPRFVKAHIEGDIHIHDYDFYCLTTTCCQIDIKSLLKDGFSTGHGYLREPNSILTASAQTCIALQANQNDQHGGQAIPNFDYGLAPYVDKSFIKHLKEIMEYEEVEGYETIISKIEGVPRDKGLFDGVVGDYIRAIVPSKMYKEAVKRTEKETYQAMEALVHNLNTMHSRAGAQVPFTSINFGTDTSYEGRLIIKAILQATWNGLGNGETPIFPISIFKVKEGINFNEGEPNYDLFLRACEVSAKRLFPNFSFLDAPFNKEFYDSSNPDTEVAYMGCRTRVCGSVFPETKGKIFGRGNLSFTSINLPRIAIEATLNHSENQMDWFWNRLEEMLKLVTEQLLERYKIQINKRVKNYPFLMGQGVWRGSEKLDDNDTLESVLKHGTLTCGFIGLAECLKMLTGYHHGESKYSQELGLSIISFMRNYMDKMSEKYNLNFSLIATPAEGLSGTFLRKDVARYGVLKGITDRKYYTNSFHIPVYYDITAYRKLSLEAPYHALCNGGHISYIEMDGDPLKNLDAFVSVIKAMKELGIGYGSINHPVDRCPVCGYTGIIDDVCPQCGRHDGEGVSIEVMKKLGFNVVEVED